MSQSEQQDAQIASAAIGERVGFRTIQLPLIVPFLLLGIGIGIGYLLWGRGLLESPDKSLLASSVTEVAGVSEIANLVEQINPPESFTLPIVFGDIGPQLIEAGAIDLEGFTKVFKDSGQPLSDEQLSILTEGSERPIEIDRENAYFLLNFFWAFGLTNTNPILDEGPLMTYAEGEIGRFASTGGWTLGVKSSSDLYSSKLIIELSSEQQGRLEEVASKVYRPCCNNQTIFPDCNHGMAMLGILEIMASENASVDEMFLAAKYINAFWFPQQSFEVAMYYNFAEESNFADIDPQRMVSEEFFSSSGFQQIHQLLVSNNLLEPDAGGGNSCGV